MTEFILLPRTQDVNVHLIRTGIDVVTLQLHQPTSLQSLSIYSQAPINKSSDLEKSYLFIQPQCFKEAIVCRFLQLLVKTAEIGSKTCFIADETKKHLRVLQTEKSLFPYQHFFLCEAPSR